MRLIDADKLSSKSCPMGTRKHCSNCGEKRTIKNPYTNQSISCDDIRFDFLQMVDREKTVDAIPIEWILRYAEERFCSIECLEEDPRVFTSQDIGDAIIYMVRNWRLENGEVNNQ